MREIPEALAAHIAQPLTTLASCLRVERKDGTVLAFTDHDQDLLVDGVTYRASEGLSPTRISSSVELSVDHLEIEGALNDDALTEADLLAGKYDGAAVTLLAVNHQSPGDGAIILKHGVFGEIMLRGSQFAVELRSLTQALQQPVGQSFSPTCRAEFGDGQCKLSLAGRSVTGSVQSVDGWQTILDTTRTETDGRYGSGVLTFTSGYLTGQSFRVREQIPGKISLLLPWPKTPEVGDTYSIVQGCDKRFVTCTGRYANGINFRGEPHLPGLDKVLATPTTQSA